MTVSQSVDDCFIEVEFDQASDSFGFSEYSVQLVSVSSGVQNSAIDNVVAATSSVMITLKLMNCNIYY